MRVALAVRRRVYDERRQALSETTTWASVVVIRLPVLSGVGGCRVSTDSASSATAVRTATARIEG